MTTYYVLSDSGTHRLPEEGENFVYLDGRGSPEVIMYADVPMICEIERRMLIAGEDGPQPENFAILTLECVLVKQGDTGHASAGNEDKAMEAIGDGGVVL
jgi:hypothetical protein